MFLETVAWSPTIPLVITYLHIPVPVSIVVGKPLQRGQYSNFRAGINR